jgi:hypothetical protein
MDVPKRFGIRQIGLVSIGTGGASLLARDKLTDVVSTGD